MNTNDLEEAKKANQQSAQKKNTQGYMTNMSNMSADNGLQQAIQSNKQSAQNSGSGFSSSMSSGSFTNSVGGTQQQNQQSGGFTSSTGSSSFTNLDEVKKQNQKSSQNKGK